MPSLTEFRQFLVESTDLSSATVKFCVEPLRAAGMVTKSPGGRAAPDITSRDAATIILGLMFGNLKKSLDNVVTYSGLVSAGYAGRDVSAALPVLLETIGLKPEHTLLDAMTRIIDLEIASELEDVLYAAGAKTGRFPEKRGKYRIRYTIETEAPKIRACVSWDAFGQTILEQEIIRGPWIDYFPAEHWENPGKHRISVAITRKFSLDNLFIREVADFLSGRLRQDE